MKTIYLVRHAKTGEALKDCDRKLTETGMERTHKLGQYLKLMSTKIDVMYASTAVRAKQTAEILAPYVKKKVNKIIYEDKLYLTHEDEYFQILIGLADKTKNVLFVGHNPDITNVLRFFIPDFNGFLRTNECYCIDIQAETWQEIFTAGKEIRFQN